MLITDTGLQRIHHPYDGGADVILTTPEERDRVRSRHTGCPLAASDRPVRHGSGDNPRQPRRADHVAAGPTSGRAASRCHS
ncbi:hypothetical protein DKG71_26500 [Streptomyces sp. NEAU-S7GS2]|nr:hypothetical protein DKG71_26500 [Streptomyces sp. NEAU-S7GS2]